MRLTTVHDTLHAQRVQEAKVGAMHAAVTVAAAAEAAGAPSSSQSDSRGGEQAPRSSGTDYVVVQEQHELLALLDELQSAKCVAVDCEGLRLGDVQGGGQLTLMQVSARKTSGGGSNAGPVRIWLVDVLALGPAAFSTPARGAQPPSQHQQQQQSDGGRQGGGARGALTLGSLLEDEGVPKLMYDVRSDAAQLLHEHGVRLRGVYDLQLAEVAVRQLQLIPTGFVLPLDKVRAAWWWWGQQPLPLRAELIADPTCALRFPPAPHTHESARRRSPTTSSARRRLSRTWLRRTRLRAPTTTATAPRCGRSGPSRRRCSTMQPLTCATCTSSWTRSTSSCRAPSSTRQDARTGGGAGGGGGRCGPPHTHRGSTAARGPSAPAVLFRPMVCAQVRAASASRVSSSTSGAGDKRRAEAPVIVRRSDVRKLINSKSPPPSQPTPQQHGVADCQPHAGAAGPGAGTPAAPGGPRAAPGPDAQQHQPTPGGRHAAGRRSRDAARRGGHAPEATAAPRQAPPRLPLRAGGDVARGLGDVATGRPTPAAASAPLLQPRKREAGEEAPLWIYDSLKQQEQEQQQQHQGQGGSEEAGAQDEGAETHVQGASQQHAWEPEGAAAAAEASTQDAQRESAATQEPGVPLLWAAAPPGLSQQRQQQSGPVLRRPSARKKK